MSGAVSSPRSVTTTSPRRPLDLGDREARVAALRPQLPAERPVVERRPAPRQPEARRPVRRVEGHARQLLPDRVAHAHRVQPGRRRRAGRGLALPDLVAVDHQHVGAGARQLARHGQAGEARAADQHVGARLVALQRRALAVPRAWRGPSSSAAPPARPGPVPRPRAGAAAQHIELGGPPRDRAPLRRPRRPDA